MFVSSTWNRACLWILFSVALLSAAVSAEAIENPFDNGYLPIYAAEVINTYPHDPTAFTQGLVYEKGILYESTGKRGRSRVRAVELATGKALYDVRIDRNCFGEGLTLFRDRLIQLTWTSHTAFTYRAEDLEQIGIHTIPFSGWGITHDGNRLIASDGSTELYYLDPETLEITGKLSVRGPAGSVNGINELEFINGQIYANMFPTDWIARIDPVSGNVTDWIDLHRLREKNKANTGTLNGIAYDPETETFLVTGKNWSEIYAIKLKLRYRRPVKPRTRLFRGSN